MANPDVIPVKLWIETPTYNAFVSAVDWGKASPSFFVIPRMGMPGCCDCVPVAASSIVDTFRRYVRRLVGGERFTEGVIEFSDEGQIRFDRREPVVSWKIRASTYGGRWEDAGSVDDATLIHRAIVAYQTWRTEALAREREAT